MSRNPLLVHPAQQLQESADRFCLVSWLAIILRFFYNLGVLQTLTLGSIKRHELEGFGAFRHILVTLVGILVLDLQSPCDMGLAL